MNPYRSALTTFGYGPASLIKDVWHHRSLIVRLSRREIEARYKGSFLGIIWSLLLPLTTMCIYTFVFAGMLKQRWEQLPDNPQAYGIVLFSGLILSNLFSECMVRAPSLVLEHAEYVKRVVFPLEILSCISLSSALFTAGLSTLVLLVAYPFVLGIPPWTVILLPLVWLPLLLFTVGFSWILASLGVFIRDLRHVVGVLTPLLVFISPVLYPLSKFGNYQKYVYLNPLTLAVNQTREVLFWGHVPRWELTLASLAAAWIVAWLGFLWFCKTRKGFADVL